MNKRYMMHNRLLTALLLALSGGFLDAYTYIYRGGVFANAQTGNMVLLAISIAENNFERIILYIIPICAFITGIFISEYFFKKESDESFRKWRHYIVLLEALICIIISFLGKDVPDLLVNSMVSFVASLQVNSFRKVHEMPYSNAFCTGNLRSATQRMVAFILDHNKKELFNSFIYLSIIIIFIFGAAVGTLLTLAYEAKAILAVVIILLIVFTLLKYDYIKEIRE